MCRRIDTWLLLSAMFVANLAAPVQALQAGSQAPKKKNVLFIIADDLNTFLGCYGDQLAKTPNIDRLAARGVRFDHAYCQFPLCGPSRNSMLTGLYPNSTGIIVNAQVFRQTIPMNHSLPQLFRRNDYFAARIGKLYHYGVPGSVGTDGHDDPASWELELNPAGVDRLEELEHTFTLQSGQFGGTPSWYASPEDDARHTDGILASDAKWVLQRCAQRKERPFFLAVGFFRPHTPYSSPKKYFEHYPLDEMPVVEGIEEDLVDIPPAALYTFRQRIKWTDKLRRECVQAYRAAITFMDAQVGKVVDELDRLGLADDTIIVFTSDHGYHMGEHGLWQKMSIFEESARVPLLIVAPGVAQNGAVAESPVGLVDLYPTLAELCGIKPRDKLHGQSLVAILKDPTRAGRGWALSQVTRKRNGTGSKDFFGYSLRTPQWRYTEWDEGDQGRELYDHQADPRELTNLADSAMHRQIVNTLSSQLRTAIKDTFPELGERPEVQSSLWMPNLTLPEQGR